MTFYYMGDGEEKPRPLVYFKHLVPPTGLFWTIFLPCHSSQFNFPAF